MTTTPTKDPMMPAKITYILYGVGFAFPPAVLAGLVYAYIARGQTPALDTHMSFLIRTFWIGLAITIFGLITAFMLIGFAVLVFWVVWTIVRLVTGLLLAFDGNPVSGTKLLGMVAV